MTGKTLAAVIVTCLVVLVLGGIIIADILGGDGEYAGELVAAIVTILAGVGAAVAAGRLPGSGQRGYVTVHRLAVVGLLALGLVALMAFAGCAHQSVSGDVLADIKAGRGGGVYAKADTDPDYRVSLTGDGLTIVSALCGLDEKPAGLDREEVSCGAEKCSRWRLTCVDVDQEVSMRIWITDGGS